MKRGMKMGAMLAALALLLGGYAVIERTSQTQSVSETAGSFPLWQEGTAVSALSWTREEEYFAFEMGESVWMRSGDASFPVNQTAVQNLADKISGLTAARQLTDVGDAADYGLDEPTFSVTATGEDGSEVTYSMGDATPFEDGYYLSVSGDDAVYVIESSLETAFNKTLTQLAVMEDMPQAENVPRVAVSVGMEIAYDEASGGWRDAATGETLDAELAQAFADDAAGLTWSALIETGATDEQLAEWMLGDAQATTVTLYDGETAVRTVLLGGEDEDGDRYARLPDSRMVYTLYGSDVDAVLEASIDTLWEKTPVALTAEEITSAAFTWADGQRTLTEEDVQGETAQSILSQLTALEGTARAEMEKTDAPALTVILSGVPGAADEEAEEAVTAAEDAATDGEASEDGAQSVTQTLEIYAYNVDSYWIEIQGGTGMLVDADDVDKLIRMLKQQG